MKIIKITPHLQYLTLLLFLTILGCSNKITVPDEAKLIWQGIPDTANEWQNITQEREGTLYLVDAKSGKVDQVRTIWKEKPNFTFTIDIGKEYQLYFRPEPIDH